MRLIEALKFRVKDVHFDRHEILVGDGKGAKDRVTTLLKSLMAALKEHPVRRRAIFDADVVAGQADVWMPDALGRKYPKWPAVNGAGNLSLFLNVCTGPVIGSSESIIKTHLQIFKFLNLPRHIFKSSKSSDIFIFHIPPDNLRTVIDRTRTPRV